MRLCTVTPESVEVPPDDVTPRSRMRCDGPSIDIVTEATTPASPSALARPAGV